MNTEAQSGSRDRGARWLVLGAGGFVGQAVLAELEARHGDVMGADHAAPLSATVAARGTLRTLDVFDVHNLRALLRSQRPTVLLNAIGHDPMATDYELREFYVRSATSVLEAVRAIQPACRVLLLGSAAEYGNSPETGGSRETDLPHPLSAYGRAKGDQFEVACRFVADGLDVITARLFNAVGPGQSNRQFVGALLERIRQGEHPLRVRSGNHVRDWIDVRDVAGALITLAEAAKPPSVANICTGTGQTVGFVAAAIGRLAGVEVEVEPGETSPSVLWRSVGNPERMLGLGWRPRRRLEESLADQWRHSQ